MTGGRGMNRKGATAEKPGAPGINAADVQERVRE